MDIISIKSDHNQYLKLCRVVIAGQQTPYFLIASYQLLLESLQYYKPTILLSSSLQLLKETEATEKKLLISPTLFNSLKLGTRQFPIVGLYWFKAIKKKRSDIDNCQRMILILNQIQNTRNLGAILRTAYAYGIHTILLTTGSCYPYSFKVLEVARIPNIFQFNFKFLSNSETVCWLKTNGYTIIGATASERVNNCSWEQIIGPENKKLALIIGSEGTGIASELQKCVRHWITICTPVKIHSLNVAVAFAVIISMYYSKSSKSQPR